MILLQKITGPDARAEAWSAIWGGHWAESQVVVLLAATATAEVPGISAAGATPESRRQTAAADAELLLLGPAGPRPHALPPLPAGVSPALISHVVLRELKLTPLVIDLGCAVPPAIPHLRPGRGAGAGPSRHLCGGDAMDAGRVVELLRLGGRWGRSMARRSPPRPLLVAECVPGGTTTAQAVLTGLGVEAAGLVSGSLRQPAHELKAALVAEGLAAAGLTGPLPEVETDGERVVAAVGDPMQPLAAGLVMAAAEAGIPVLLAGGSQMAAVMALALALAPIPVRHRIASLVALGTTSWVAGEAGSDLSLLLERIGERWGVSPLAFSAGLRFPDPIHPALSCYERGYVKEGVGAGGLALLWQLSGRTPHQLARACDLSCRELLEPAPLRLPPPPGARGHLRSSHG